MDDALKVLDQLEKDKKIRLQLFCDEYRIYIETLNSQVFGPNGLMLTVTKKEE